MDLRTQTSLLGCVLSFALALTVLLRPHKRRVHWLFVSFDLAVSAWYGTTFLARWDGGRAWQQLNVVLAVLLPVAAVEFFRAFLLASSRRAVQLNRTSLVVGLVLIALALSPLHRSPALLGSVFVYVFWLLASAMLLVARAAQRTHSPLDAARLRYLALVGTFAAVFTLADYLPYVGLDVPPVGTVLVLVFLYVLSQSILSHRLLDLYELGGRLFLLTALSFILAGVLWVLVWLDPGNFYLHSVAAALVLQLTFEPIQHALAGRIGTFLTRERSDLVELIAQTRGRASGAIPLDDVVRETLVSLEGLKRATRGSVYLLGPDQLAFHRRAQFGPASPAHVDRSRAKPLLDRMAQGPVLLDALDRQLESNEPLEATRHAVELLRELGASVAVPIRGEGGLHGFLLVRDDRVRDVYSPEDADLLGALGAELARAVENTNLYAQLRDRDRLATLGAMAAGLAHEIRNPLGSIKASAQFLAEPGDDPREFLGIIVDEVDRLNRVVSSFLDYARPSSQAPAPAIDVNATLGRTVELIRRDLSPTARILEQYAGDVPRAHIDPERLRQVILNLVQNAVQAMEGRGTVRLSSRAGQDGRTVEVDVADEGPGLPERVRAHLFVPFVTTKDRGTGLGLAISQRIVSEAGGRILVYTGNSGTTFTIQLPVEPVRG